MAVLHLFLVNSPLIYILFSISVDEDLTRTHEWDLLIQQMYIFPYNSTTDQPITRDILGLKYKMCTFFSALTTLHSGSSDFRRERVAIHFFKPIVHFYMKADAFPNRVLRHPVHVCIV